MRKVLLINCYIQNSNTNSALLDDERISIFLYFLMSFKFLNVDFSLVSINIELQRHNAKKIREIKKIAKLIFRKLEFKNKRFISQLQWIQFCKETKNFSSKDIIFYFGNDDHLYLNKDKNLLRKCLEDYEIFLKKNHNYNCSLHLSHFQENINRFTFKYQQKFSTNYLYGKNCNNPLWALDSIQLTTFQVFRYWWEKNNLKGFWLPRTDPPSRIKSNPTFIKSPKFLVIFVPKKEIFRHADAYDHHKLGIPLKYLPAIKLNEKAKINIDKFLNAKYSTVNWNGYFDGIELFSNTSKYPSDIRGEAKKIQEFYSSHILLGPYKIFLQNILLCNISTINKFIVVFNCHKVALLNFISSLITKIYLFKKSIHQ